MDIQKIHIESYRYLGLEYCVNIGNRRYKLHELSDEQLDILLHINENDRSRVFSDEMIYIFKDVKKIRRRQKLNKINNIFGN